jgi:hypothetical protein
MEGYGDKSVPPTAIHSGGVLTMALQCPHQRVNAFVLELIGKSFTYGEVDRNGCQQGDDNINNVNY